MIQQRRVSLVRGVFVLLSSFVLFVCVREIFYDFFVLSEWNGLCCSAYYSVYCVESVYWTLYSVYSIEQYSVCVLCSVCVCVCVVSV